jgi:hypothetical protein
MHAVAQLESQRDWLALHSHRTALAGQNKERRAGWIRFAGNLKFLMRFNPIVEMVILANSEGRPPL